MYILNPGVAVHLVIQVMYGHQDKADGFIETLLEAKVMPQAVYYVCSVKQDSTHSNHARYAAHRIVLASWHERTGSFSFFLFFFFFPFFSFFSSFFFSRSCICLPMCTLFNDYRI